MFSGRVSQQTVLLLLGDAGILLGSLAVGIWLQTSTGGPHALPALPKTMTFLLIALASFSLLDLYAAAGERNPLPNVAGRVAVAAITWAGMYAALGLTFPNLGLGRAAAVGGIAVGSAGALAFRWLVATHPAMRRTRRLLVLGATPIADRLIAELETHSAGYEIVGYLDDRPAHEVRATNGFRVLGSTAQVAEVAAATQTDAIVVTLTERRGALPVQAILDCKLRGIQVDDWPSFYERLTGKILVHNLRPSWLIFSDGFRRPQLTRLLKHWSDLAISVCIVLSAWPVFLLVALAIKLDSSGPILFRQERIGERGRRFTLLKFRTMVQGAESQSGPVWASEDDPRITRVGRWLRKTRLDEFPQLINVLRGDMSFVGPRPERPHFVAQLTDLIPFYAQRHVVKPGITGWAQIRYRYGATVADAEEKLQYDLYYIKHLSFLLDLFIIFSSIRVVLCGKGAR